MIQANNTTSIDETDGLPMPRRIWAVVSIGFALCMSVLDVNIINIVLPYAFARFRNFACCNYVDYKWLSVGYRCFAAVFLFFGGDYRLSESVPVGHWAVLHHFADLRLVRFILDADDCTYLSGIQCVGHHKCEYGAAALRIPEKPDRAGNGNQCDGSGDIGGCRSVGGKRHTFDSQLALAVCYQCTARDYGTATGYQAFAKTGRAVEAEV